MGPPSRARGAERRPERGAKRRTEAGAEPLGPGGVAPPDLPTFTVIAKKVKIFSKKDRDTQPNPCYSAKNNVAMRMIATFMPITNICLLLHLQFNIIFYETLLLFLPSECKTITSIWIPQLLNFLRELDSNSKLPKRRLVQSSEETFFNYSSNMGLSEVNLCYCK